MVECILVLGSGCGTKKQILKELIDMLPEKGKFSFEIKNAAYKDKL